MPPGRTPCLLTGQLRDWSNLRTVKKVHQRPVVVPSAAPAAARSPPQPRGGECTSPRGTLRAAGHRTPGASGGDANQGPQSDDQGQEGDPVKSARRQRRLFTRSADGLSRRSLTPQSPRPHSAGASERPLGVGAGAEVVANTRAVGHAATTSPYFTGCDGLSRRLLTPPTSPTPHSVGERPLGGGDTHDDETSPGTETAALALAFTRCWGSSHTLTLTEFPDSSPALTLTRC